MAGFGELYKDIDKFIKEGNRDEKNSIKYKNMINEALDSNEKDLKNCKVKYDEINYNLKKYYKIILEGFNAKEQTALEKANRTTMFQNTKQKRKTTHGGSRKTKKRKSKSKKHKTRK